MSGNTFFLFNNVKNNIKRFKVISLKGFQARISKGEAGRLYIKWHTPQGCEVKDWSEYKTELDPLLLKVRSWADNFRGENLTLCSY